MTRLGPLDGFPGEQGFVLDARTAGGARFRVGSGMRFGRAELEWLAGQLESGVRLVREEMT